MHEERPILSNLCDKIYIDFSDLGQGNYHCNSCNKLVKDISEKDDVNYDDYTGKCIVATLDQVDEIRFIHPLRRFAVALFIVFGSSLFIIPESFAQQTITVSEKKVDGATLMGKVVGDRNIGLSGADIKLVFKDGEELDYKTNESGNFIIKIPKEYIDTKFQVIFSYDDSKKKKKYNLALNEIKEIETIILKVDQTPYRRIVGLFVTKKGAKLLPEKMLL